MTTTRPWPTPGPDEPDFVIRCPKRVALLRVWAQTDLHGSDIAARILREHEVAVAANMHLCAAWARWRESRAEVRS